MTTLSLLQLYPEQLGVSGDGGNVVALAERARRAGLDVELVEHRPGDALPVGADLVLIGSGPLSTLRSIHADALRFRDLLADWGDSGVPVIAIGGGMELLSHGISGEGADLEGLGFFEASAHRGAQRRAGYFRVETPYSGPSLTLFGFEDHATRLELAAGASAFGTVVTGGGNGDGSEGVARGSSFGTQLKGPVLPLNPVLADGILSTAVSRIGGHYATGEPHATLDEYAKQSRLVIEKNLERAFKAM